MSTSQTSHGCAGERTVSVWDPFVRLAHWALVVAFAVAYLSGDDDGGAQQTLHVWSGYVVGSIVVARIAWGVVGTRHARFADFVGSPVAALFYVGKLLFGHARRYIGHSPAGGAMVVLLLASLVGTTVTGLMAYGQQGKGPLAAAGPSIVQPAQADNGRRAVRDEGRSKPTGGAVGELHELLADLTLGLVGLHILGVGLASIAHRENLIVSMVDGRKRGPG